MNAYELSLYSQEKKFDSKRNEDFQLNAHYNVIFGQSKLHSSSNILQVL